MNAESNPNNTEHQATDLTPVAGRVVPLDDLRRGHGELLRLARVQMGVVIARACADLGPEMLREVMAEIGMDEAEAVRMLNVALDAQPRLRLRLAK